jgi:hypothetical protein
LVEDLIFFSFFLFFLTQLKANLHCKEKKIQPPPAETARGGGQANILTKPVSWTTKKEKMTHKYKRTWQKPNTRPGRGQKATTGLAVEATLMHIKSVDWPNQPPSKVVVNHDHKDVLPTPESFKLPVNFTLIFLPF